jgi:hypothetical protein
VKTTKFPSRPKAKPQHRWILVTYCDSGYRDAISIPTASISFDARLIKEKISQIVAQTNTVKEQHRMVEQAKEHIPEFLHEAIAHAQGHNAQVLAELDKNIKRYSTAEAIVDGMLVRGIELTDDFERVKAYTKGTM